MIVTFPTPHVEILRDDICWHLDANVRVLLSTAATIDALIASLHEARELVVLQDRARSERAEQMAARLVNKGNEASHKAWGSTLSGTVTPIESVEKTVKFVSCDCTRSFICDDHVQHGDDVA